MQKPSFEKGQRIHGFVIERVQEIPELRSIALIEAERHRGEVITRECRHYITTLTGEARQLAHAARAHWGVETTHQILDTALLEDDHPWIESNPRAAYALAVLRRIAYTMLALFRSVTQRCDDRRRTPWRTLMHWLNVALLTAKEVDVAGLRTRRPAAA